jgi:hypothetical protein
MALGVFLIVFFEKFFKKGNGITLLDAEEQL